MASDPVTNSIRLRHTVPQTEIADPSATMLVGSTLIVVLGAGLALPYALIVAGAAAPVRSLFVPYVLAVSVLLISWRRSLYVPFIIAIFAFDAYLRRLIDYRVGFVAFNPVLLAPYVALLPTLPSLARRVFGHTSGLNWPFAIIAACMSYGMFLSLFQMRFVPALYEPLHWLMPVSFCTFIMEEPHYNGEIKFCLVTSLVLIVPILSVYGVLQYMSPSLPDVYWMLNVHVSAFGYPRPYAVRVFSMMNSPLAAGVFGVSAMILLAGEGPLCLMVAALGLPLLALTSLRESWVICAVSLVVLFATATPSRKVSLLGGIAAAALAVSLLISSHVIPTEIVNQLDRRFSSLSDVEHGTDESAGGRMTTYGSLFERLADNPQGEGFGVNTSVATTGDKRDLPALDSFVLESAITFGVVIGTLYFLAVGTLLAAAFKASRFSKGRLSAFAALLVGIVVTAPIGGNLVGEVSILAWTAIGILLASVDPRAPRFGANATGRHRMA